MKIWAAGVPQTVMLDKTPMTRPAAKFDRIPVLDSWR
jgi:hypothetical protein